MESAASNWSYGDAQDIDTSNPIDHPEDFDLIFLDLAESAQYFPSNDRPGNTSNTPDGWFDGWPSNPNDLRIDYEGVVCTDGSIGCHVDATNTIGERLVPLAIQYVAQIYKLFWEQNNFSINVPASVPVLTAFSVSASGKIGGVVPSEYAWDFDYDGNTANFIADAYGQSTTVPAETYKNYSGQTKTICLKTTTSGTIRYTTQSILITPPPINISRPDGCEAKHIHFSTTDYGSRITEYTWNYGDGTPTETGRSNGHTYANEGSYNVSVTLTLPDGGGSISNTQPIYVGSGTQYISGHTIYGEETWSCGSNYVVQGSITVAKGGKLTIQSGVTVKLTHTENGAAINVNGTLTATGVTFTWADGQNQWGGIAFNSASSSGSRLENCIIEHASGWFVDWGINSWVSGIIYITQSSPTITGCTINSSSSAGYGMHLASSSPIISNCIISGMSIGVGVEYTSNPTVTGSTISGNSTGISIDSSSSGTYQGNTISGNTSYGINYSGSTVINASYTYWGDPTGPLDASDDRASGGWYNPNGKGNTVSNKVKYTPWVGVPLNTTDNATVGPDSEYKNVADAIAAVNEGGTIKVNSGDYTGFEIWKSGLTIIGDKSSNGTMPLINGEGVDYNLDNGTVRKAAIYITQDNTTVMGFTISGDSGYDTAMAVGNNATGVHLHFNNLFFTEQTTTPDTMTGLAVVGTETVDARMNWWGDATGPGFGQSTVFDSCIGQAYAAGQGVTMLGYGCFVPHLFKEFLGLIEPKVLGSYAVAIDALGSLAATASTDSAVKMVFSSFDSEPIADTAPVDPFAYFGIMAWDGISENQRLINLNLCGYVDADSAVYWSDNSDAGWTAASGSVFDQGCVQLAINNSSVPAASDMAGLLFAASLSQPLPTTSTIPTTTSVSSSTTSSIILITTTSIPTTSTTVLPTISTINSTTSTSVLASTTTSVQSTTSTVVSTTTTAGSSTTTTAGGGSTTTTPVTTTAPITTTIPVTTTAPVTSTVPATTTTVAGGSTTTTSVSPITTTTTVSGGTTTTTTVCPATQVLGANNPKLQNLRTFRDSKLAQSAIGHKVIQIYYTNASSINAALERSPALRAVAKGMLEVIAPMVGNN